MPTKEAQTLYLTELFQSIQGETSDVGIPTTFIRLSGCNLACQWCDTTYARAKGKKYAIEEIVKQVQAFGHPKICITGGEPLLQPAVYSLLHRLCDRGYGVRLETNGAIDTSSVDKRVQIILDVKCPGSGQQAHNLWDNLHRLRLADEVKFVLADRTDYDYAKEICTQYKLFDRTTPPLFSPVHGILDPQLLIAWILADKLPVRLNLQLHKYVWPPETRGV